MRKNIYLVLSVFIVLGLILTACGGTTTTPTETTAPTTPVEESEEPAETTAPTEPVAEKVTLKIYLLDYTPDTIEWLKSEINPAFEAAHPGVTVEITEGTWSGWDTTFSGFFAAGEGPDIINLGSEMNTLYGESLADMDPYLGEAAWPEITNFGPALENAKYDGKIRGLPIFTAPRYVFCRTDIMEAGGWTTGTPKNFAARSSAPCCGLEAALRFSRIPRGFYLSLHL
jgi:ABC-type glycerol-3-phosphate transport system substrate-binding protein